MEPVVVDFEGLKVEVSYKKIKNMYIRLNPADRTVRVSVPLKTSQKQLEDLLQQKRSWILEKLAAMPAIPPKSDYADGSHIMLWGNPVLLRVYPCSGRPALELVDNQLRLYMNKEYDIENVMGWWYGQQVLHRSRTYFEKWEPIMGVSAREVRVRRMKTRWGTCVINDKRIWLSAALGEKPEACLEYIVVHELNHLLEYGHNKRFYHLMDKFLPDWRMRKALLNGAVFEEEPT